MSIVPGPSTSSGVRPTRRPRRLRWARRVLVLAALLALVAAVLPAVTSGPGLAGVIADYIRGQINLPTQIADASWGWWSGLELRDVHADRGDGTSVRIQRVKVQAGLWDLIQGRSLGHVHVDGMTVDLPVGSARKPDPVEAANAAGRQRAVATRAARLMKRRPGQKSGINYIPLDQISLSSCAINVRQEPGGRCVRVFLPGGMVRLDRQTGAVNWRVSAKVEGGGLLATEGSFILPRLAIVPSDLGGWLQVTWRDVPLRDLPRRVPARMGLKDLEGLTGGRVRLSLSRDWMLTYDVSGAMTGLTARNAAGTRMRLPLAAGGVAGRWQMIDQRMEVEEAWVELPGARVKASAPALVYDGRAGQVLRSNLAGTVEDAQALRGALADLGLVLPEQLGLSGQADVEAHVGREQDLTRVEMALHGRRLAAAWPGVLRREAGSPLAARAVLELRDDGRLVLRSGQLEVPGAQLAATAEFGSAADEPMRAFAFRRGRAEFRWDDFKALAAQMPIVAEKLGSLASVRGPGGVEVQATLTEQSGLMADASLTLPQAAEVLLGDWLHKPLGHDLRVETSARLGASYNSFDVDHVTVASDGLTLARVQEITSRAAKQLLADGAVRRPILLLDLRAVLASLDLSGLQAFSPRLAEAIGRAGSAGGTLRGRIAISCWADIRDRHMQLAGVNAAGELDLQQAALQFEELVHKPAGEKLRVATSYSYRWDGPKGYGYGSGSVEAAGFAGQGWYERSAGGAGPMQWSWGWLDVRDVQRTAAMLPAVAEAIQHDDVAGKMAARWEWSRQSESFDLHTLFDLTGVRAARPEARIHKPAGLPARLDVVISGPAGRGAESEARHWRLPKAELTLGKSRAGVTDGQIEMAEPWAKLLAGQGREAFGSIGVTWPIRNARAKLSGVTVFGEAPVSEDVKALLAPYSAAGPVHWTLECSYDAGHGLDFIADVEARELALAAGQLHKASGAPLHTDIRGNVRGYHDATHVPHVQLTVADASGQISNLEWKGQGQVLCQCVGGELDLLSARISGSGQSRQLAELVPVVAAAEPWQVQGHAAWEGTCTFDEQNGWRLEDLDVGLWPVEWKWLGVPCRLEGLLNVRQNSASATGLAAKLGRTAGRFTFHAAREGNVLVDQLGASFRTIDLDELAEIYNRFRLSGFRVSGSGVRVAVKEGAQRGRRPQTDMGTPTSRTKSIGEGSVVGREEGVAPGMPGGTGRASETVVQSGVVAAQPGAQGATSTRPAIDLARSTFDFMGQTDSLRFTLEPGRDPVQMRLLSWNGSVASGEVNVDLAGAFEGGSLVAQVTGRLDDNAPWRIRYRAERAQPTPLTQWLVVRSFPGMRADGPVTLEETLIIDPKAKGGAIPGSGEMIVEGGEVWGAAAPRAIQRIFPKLELARFQFSRLHNWFDRDAHGRTLNRMIYRGTPWSLYMNGWSEADGTFRYEIGVDLLGPIESEYWATADRGRVPLFIKTGQVVSGRIRDEVIRYLSPQQVIGRILKDNLLTIAYHAVRQQVLRGRTDGSRVSGLGVREQPQPQ